MQKISTQASKENLNNSKYSNISNTQILTQSKIKDKKKELKLDFSDHEEEKKGNFKACRDCEINANIDLPRFILVKTNNKIIKRSKIHKDVVDFPNCSCDKKLNLKELINLFGKGKMNHVYWGIMEPSEEVQCQSCL